MAGYLFTIDSMESLHACMLRGVYSTRLGGQPSGHWSIAAEGTFADYATMQEGADVFFFIDRIIYGVGRLVAVGPDCKYSNFPGASQPEAFDYGTVRSSLLLDDGPESMRQRWLCVFASDPFFFTRGVDMDDALSSNPEAFRMLRAIWKLSFIKLDDEESQALRDVILKNNQEALSSPRIKDNVFADMHADVHAGIARRVGQEGYHLDASTVMGSCANADGTLRHEMALEAGLLAQLAGGERSTIDVLGAWDYLSHQVIASPFKPIDYMDKMDVFGYRYIPEHRPTVAQYLVVEMKKGAASRQDVGQLLKYVDWVKEEYAHGDYSMIRAFLIAGSFDDDAVFYAEEAARRFYTVQRRPPLSGEWRDMRLLRYRFDGLSGLLRLQPVDGSSVDPRL